ncbi:MAG: thiamine diphosphokinase [Oscillospiraceae bacterium]|nr:thiamine diphosphokinase [Oscillospiraceae bacterium]
MGKCIIFCAGGFDSLLEPIMADDLVIAADGGLRHTQNLGVRPGVILGDFDSLGYVPEGSEVFPCEKDDTDAMLAVRCGLDAGFREFMIYGGVEGPRLEHTVANFQTLQYLAERSARGYLIGKNQIVFVLSPGQVIFPNTAKGYLSVFCLGQDAAGVSLDGLHYPMHNGTLTAGFPLGVSNRFIGEEAHISVKSGYLLLIWDRDNGIPQVAQDK